MIKVENSRNRIPSRVFRDVDGCSSHLCDLLEHDVCVVNSIQELDDKIRQLGILSINTDNVDELKCEAVMIVKVRDDKELRKLYDTFVERFTIWAVCTGDSLDYNEMLAVLENTSF